MKVWQEQGFTLIELLMIVTIIGVIAALAVPGLLRARMAANESSAIASLRAINSGQTAYLASCGQGGYATSLMILGQTCTGGTQGFISSDLIGPAPVLKSGYNLTVTGNGTDGPIDLNGTRTNTDYVAIAVPLTVSTTGQRGFHTSGAGTIFTDVGGGSSGTTALQ